MFSYRVPSLSLSNVLFQSLRTPMRIGEQQLKYVPDLTAFSRRRSPVRSGFAHSRPRDTQLLSPTAEG